MPPILCTILSIACWYKGVYAAAAVSELLATENIGVTLPPPVFTLSPNPALSKCLATQGLGNVTGLDRSYAAASCCNIEQLYYSSASTAWEAVATPTTGCTVRSDSYSVTLIDNGVSVDLVTLCDGHPRTPEGFTYPFLTTWYSETLTVCGTPTRIQPGPYPGVSPNCTIGPSDCARLFVTSLLRTTGIPITPACTTNTVFQPACGPCYISANQLELSYWPVTTVSGSPCSDNGSTITAQPTGYGPNTMVVGSLPLTSGPAYLSFPGIYATVSNGALCGTVVTNFGIGIPTFDLQTLSYSYIAPEYTNAEIYYESMNLGDMNWPVPWSAYRGMPGCDGSSGGACDTMSYGYQPQVAIPSWFTGLQKQWWTCTVGTAGVYDPPVSLTEVASIAMPTQPMTTSTPSDSSTAAAPAAPVMSSFAPATSSALPTTSSATPLTKSVESTPPQSIAPSSYSAVSTHPSNSQPPSREEPSATSTSVENGTEEASTKESSINIASYIASIIGATAAVSAPTPRPSGGAYSTLNQSVDGSQSPQSTFRAANPGSITPGSLDGVSINPTPASPDIPSGEAHSVDPTDTTSAARLVESAASTLFSVATTADEADTGSMPTISGISHGTVGAHSSALGADPNTALQSSTSDIGSALASEIGILLADPTSAAQTSGHNPSISKPGAATSGTAYQATAALPSVTQGSVQGQQSGSTTALSLTVIEHSTSAISVISQITKGTLALSASSGTQDSTAITPTSGQLIESISTSSASTSTSGSVVTSGGVFPSQARAHRGYMPLAQLATVLLITQIMLA